MNKEKHLINIKQLLKGIILFILFYYSSLLQLIPISLFNINMKTASNDTKVLLTTFSNILLLLILIIIYRKELKEEWKKFKNNFLVNIDCSIKYWLVGLFFMMVSNIIIAFILGVGQAENEKAVQEMISSLPWLMLIVAGIIAPIIEEIIFRKCFKNAFNNKWLFIITSGIVFGALHVVTSFNSPIELLYIIPYSSLGISFAYMYSKTDTIYTSVTAHMLHNTILTLLSILT